MPSPFTANSCGGAGWRTLPGGLIEVENRGIPSVDPSSARFANLSRTWANFGSILGPAADSVRLPRSWLLAFATVETGFLSGNRGAQAAARSPVGAAGVMQLMPQFFTSFTLDELLNPSINIPAAAAFIRRLCDSSSCPGRCELPYLGSVYNAGSGKSCIQCQTGRNVFNFVEDADYSMQLVEFNNAALTHLRLESSALAWAAGGALIAGAAALTWFS